MAANVVVVTSTGADVAVVGPDVVVAFGRVVGAVRGALEVVGRPLVTVVSGAPVVVELSAAPAVELVGTSAGTASPCPRLAADTSTPGLSP